MSAMRQRLSAAATAAAAAAAALLLGLTATPALAGEDVVWEQQTSWQRYATEIFADGSSGTVVRAPAGEPMQVKLRVVSGELSVAAQGSIRFTLTNGAQFAEQVQLSDLTGISATSISFAPGRGGRPGESVADFLVGAPRPGSTLTSGDAITLDIRALQNVQALADRSQTINVRVDTFAGADPSDGGGAFRSGQIGPGSAAGTIFQGRPGQIATSYPAFVAGLEEGVDDDLLDDGQLLLARLSLRADPGIQLNADGSDINFGTLGRDLLTINVANNGLAVGRIYVDSNGNGTRDADERLGAFHQDITLSQLSSDLDSIGIYYLPDSGTTPTSGSATVSAEYGWSHPDSSATTYTSPANPVTATLTVPLQELRFTQTASAVTYATEIFGDGSQNTVLDAAGMTVTLTVADGTGVDEGGSGFLTFNFFNNVSLGRDVQLDNLAFNRRSGGSDGINITRATNNGVNRARTTQARFRVAVDSGALVGGDTFTFTVPAIEFARALGTADTQLFVQATYQRDAAGPGSGNFPRTIKSADTGAIAENGLIATSADAFDYTLAPGINGTIDPANPARFAGANNIDTDGDGTDDSVGLLLGNLTLRLNDGDQLRQDGSDFGFRSVDSLSINVTGPRIDPSDSHQNHMVFIDRDKDGVIDSGETNNRWDDGERTTYYSLTFDNAQQTAPLDNVPIYYVPVGNATLAAATYTLATDYDFDREDGTSASYKALNLTTATTTSLGVPPPADVRFTQDASAVTYATEIFGDGSEATRLAAAGMNVTLTVQPGTGIAADSGQIGTITFRLGNNATFGDIATDSLTLDRSNGSSGNITIGHRQAVAAPGSPVDPSTATFVLGNNRQPIVAGDTFTFAIPSIGNAHALATAGETIEVGVTTRPAADFDGSHGLRNGTIGVSVDPAAGAAADLGNITANAIAASADAWNISFDPSQHPVTAIDADNRTRFADGPVIRSDDDEPVAVHEFGRFTWLLNDGVQADADGNDLGYESSDRALYGTRIMTTGAFGNNAIGLYNPSGTPVFVHYDQPHDIEILPGSLTEQNGLEGPASNLPIYFLPDGGSNLLPTAFTSTITITDLPATYKRFTFTQTSETVLEGTLPAARFTQTANAVTYARELFADGSNPTLDAAGMNITLTVQEGTGVGSNAGGDIGFDMTFGGAAIRNSLPFFLEDIDADNLVFSKADGTTHDVGITLKERGEAGSSTAVFTIATNNSSIAANDTFTFTIPAVSFIAGIDAIDATIEVAVNTAADTGGGFRSGTLGTDPDLGNATDSTIAAFANALALDLDDGTAATIDAANRTRFAGAAAMRLGSIAIGAAPDVHLGNLAIGGGSNDTIAISVNGTYNSSDTVFIDLDDDNQPDAGETFAISGDIAGAGITADLLTGRAHIYYLPGGDTDLAAAAFQVGATYTYANTVLGSVAGVQANPVNSILGTEPQPDPEPQPTINPPLLVIGDGGSATIDIADRTRLAGTRTINIADPTRPADTPNLGGLPATARADTAALFLGTIAATEDPAVPADSRHVPDAADRLAITVSGLFNPGDIVFIDLDNDNTVTDSERLALAAPATATGTFPGNILQAYLAVATFPVGSAPSALNLHYLPAGESTLQPATYRIAAVYGYAGGSIRGRQAVPAQIGHNRFGNLILDGWALAITGSSDAEKVNVRITNEMFHPVTVYAEGYGEDGAYLDLVELSDLAGNQTEVYDADELEAAFCGMVDPGCWEGRARFQFFRRPGDNISIQSFQRGNDRNLRNMMSSTGLEIADDGQVVR